MNLFGNESIITDPDGTKSKYVYDSETNTTKKIKLSEDEQIQIERELEEVKAQYEPTEEEDPSIYTDVKRVGLNVIDMPFRLASDFVVGPTFKLGQRFGLLEEDFDYDLSARKAAKKRREYIVKELNDVTDDLAYLKGRINGKAS